LRTETLLAVVVYEVDMKLLARPVRTSIPYATPGRDDFAEPSNEGNAVLAPLPSIPIKPSVDSRAAEDAQPARGW